MPQRPNQPFRLSLNRLYTFYDPCYCLASPIRIYTDILHASIHFVFFPADLADTVYCQFLQPCLCESHTSFYMSNIYFSGRNNNCLHFYGFLVVTLCLMCSLLVIISSSNFLFSKLFSARDTPHLSS